jgi:hypothetical protein
MRIEVDHSKPATIAQAFSLEKQIAGTVMGKATWEIARKALHPEVEGVENFAIARAKLKAGKSMLLYLKDPLDKKATPLGGAAVESNLEALDHAGLFVSRRQVDWHQGNHVPNYMQHLFLESFWGNYPGITMIRVVQPKDRDRYPDWAEYNDEAYKRAAAFLKTPGNVFIITPEGERNPDGLGEAQAGFAVLFREARETALAMPIAIPEGTSRVIAGIPFSYEQALEDRKLNPNMKKMKDRMMARLAILLPPQQRGVYAEATLNFRMPPIAA